MAVIDSESQIIPRWFTGDLQRVGGEGVRLENQKIEKLPFFSFEDCTPLKIGDLRWVEKLIRGRVLTQKCTKYEKLEKIEAHFQNPLPHTCTCANCSSA